MQSATVLKHPRSETIQNESSNMEISNDVRILISKISERSKEAIDEKESIESELAGFKIVELKSFFIEFPHAWNDLKRKLHTISEKNNGK
jgi:hypothetical protein